MGGSGMILGGLLGGIGKGMEITALQAREDAMEALREQRRIAQEGREEQTLIGREGRLEDRVIRQEGRADVREENKDKREYTMKSGLLALSQQYKMQENETEFQYKTRLEKIKQQGDANLARLKSGLDRSNDAASIKLKAALDDGQVDSTEVDAAGNIVILYKNGKTEVTAIKAKPTAAEIKAEDEDAEEAAREERRAARRGETVEKPAAKKPAGKKVPDADYNALYSQAAARAQRGEPGYKGLDAAGIEAKVKGILRKNGYDI